MPYGDALVLQRERHAAVLEGRGSGGPHRLLLVEHPPVITVTRRPGADAHVLADDRTLAAAGVERHETDRGGDVTYHGPGQAVAYPIVDLQRIGSGIHAYIRALEEALEGFAGCAVVVSHDRWFLDRVATHILAFEGDSQVQWFAGNYSSYLEDYRRRKGHDADTPKRIKYRRLTR